MTMMNINSDWYWRSKEDGSEGIAKIKDGADEMKAITSTARLK